MYASVDNAHRLHLQIHPAQANNSEISSQARQGPSPALYRRAPSSPTTSTRTTQFRLALQPVEQMVDAVVHSVGKRRASPSKLQTFTKMFQLPCVFESCGLCFRQGPGRVEEQIHRFLTTSYKFCQYSDGKDENAQRPLFVKDRYDKKVEVSDGTESLPYLLMSS